MVADQTMAADATARPFRFAMLLPVLIVDVAAPIGIFKTLEWYGISPIWALAAGCIPPALGNLHSWIRSRRLDPVGIVMMASIASGAVASLVSGNISWRIVADALLNAGWGSAFLVSLLFARPAMFSIIRELVAAGDASRIDVWNGLWRYTAFRSAMRSMTAIWGAVYFAEVLIEVGLSRVLTPDTMVTFAALMGVGATLALVVFTRQYVRATRHHLELQEHLKWPL